MRAITNIDKVILSLKNLSDDDREYIDKVKSKFQYEIILRWMKGSDIYIPLDLSQANSRDEMDLIDMFYEKPIMFLYAIREILKESFSVDDVRFFIRGKDNKVIPFKEPYLSLKSHKNDYKFMSQKGIILSVSNPKEDIIAYAFEDEEGNVRYNTSGYPPTRKSVFLEDETVKMDRIKILVQEPIDDLENMKIRPHTVEMYYYYDGTRDNVDELQPGQTILFHVIPITYTTKKSNRIVQKKEYVMVDYELLNKEFERMMLDEKDIKRVKEMSKDPDIIDNLVKSYAPHLKGIEKVKEGLMVSFFGGVKDVDNVRNRTGNIHVLIVGNPATGKSDLLNHAIKILPKKYYVSGSFSTKAGLVATVKKEDDDYYLQSGALLLANGGFLLIDEFDKFSNKEVYDSLLEAMESGKISFNKATINRIFKVDTTIIAVMNPQTPTETFQDELSILEQIKIPAPLLSRFALKFAVKIERNEENADKIADSMIKTRFEDFGVKYSYDDIRKYIAYARTYIKPQIKDKRLKEKLRDHIKKVFLIGDVAGIRAMSYVEQIAMAYAKMRLSNEVSEKDLMRAFDLLNYAMDSFGIKMDEYFMYTEKDRNKSTRSRLVEDILRLVPYEGGINHDKLVQLLQEKGYKYLNVLKAIEYLKNYGEIYEPRNGLYLRLKYKIESVGDE